MKARGDAISAVAYVGAELGSLVLNCSLTLLTAGFYYAVIMATSGWLVAYRTVLLVILAIAAVVFVFHVVKRLFLLRLLFAVVLTPPDPNAKITVGDPKKPLLAMGPFGNAGTAQPAATPGSPPASSHQAAADQDGPAGRLEK
jgi:hypothetical protein